MFCMVKEQPDLLIKYLGKISNVSDFSNFSYIINDQENLIYRKKKNIFLSLKQFGNISFHVNTAGEEEYICLCS